MFKSYLIFLMFVALLLPATATSLDTFGLSPNVVGDFVPAWELPAPEGSAPAEEIPEAWPLRLWGSEENFDGLAVSSATTEQWAYVFWIRTEPFDPGQSLYIQVGSNDVLNFGWEDYEGCMLFIVTRALALGIEKVVIVSSPQNFAWVETPPMHAAVNAVLDYEADIDADICARSEEVDCIPAFDFLNGAQYYQSDGLHLSAEGHEAIVTYVPEPSEPALLAAGLLLLPALQRAARRRGTS